MSWLEILKRKSLLCSTAQVFGVQKQEEVQMEKTPAEVSLTEAVKPKQQEVEQQRRQEAVVQKDRVSKSSEGFNWFLF